MAEWGHTIPLMNVTPQLKTAHRVPANPKRHMNVERPQHAGHRVPINHHTLDQAFKLKERGAESAAFDQNPAEVPGTYPLPYTVE